MRTYESFLREEIDTYLLRWLSGYTPNRLDDISKVTAYLYKTDGTSWERRFSWLAIDAMRKYTAYRGKTFTNANPY